MTKSRRISTRALVLLAVSAATMTTMSAHAAAPNDDFAHAQAITALPAMIPVDLWTATHEPAAPNCDAVPNPFDNPVTGYSSGKDLWYRHTATASGRITVGLDPIEEFSYATRLVNVYEAVAANDAAVVPLDVRHISCHKHEASFTAAAGSTYVFQVVGYGADTLHVALTPPVPPSNDAFAGAEMLGAQASVETTTYYASPEPGAPDSCSQSQNDVWYRFTPEQDGIAYLAAGSEEHASAALYEGNTLGSLAELACISDAAEWGQRGSSTSVPVRAGHDYAIQIAGDLAHVFATLDIGSVPANDDFEHAADIGVPFAMQESLARAWAETDEPTDCAYGVRTVWYRLVAPRTETLEIAVPASPARLVVGAYDRDRFGSLRAVACAGHVQTSDVPTSTFDVTAGHAYLIQVGGEPGALGTIGEWRLHSFVAPPPATGGPITNLTPVAEGCGEADKAYVSAEVEVSSVADPYDSKHIVTTYQQDRFSDGGARAIGVSVTKDGGATWQTILPPGLSLCSGGTSWRVTDPWVSIGKDGTVYLVTMIYDPGYPGRTAMQVSTSRDGGITWGAPVIVQPDVGTSAAHPGDGPGEEQLVFNDKPQITADTTVNGYVYLIWDYPGITVYSRSTDFGLTWSVPIPLFGGGQGGAVQVLPDGTLLCFGRVPQGGFDVIRSTDHGLTWGAPVSLGPSASSNGGQIRAFNFPVSAVGADGTAYATWYTGTDIRLVRSTDGGVSWSAPISAGGFALIPWNLTLAVHPNGTVAVSFFDRRGGDGEIPVTVWVRTSKDLVHWSERFVTDFDMQKAPTTNGGGGIYFLGDYESMVVSGNDFMPIFARPTEEGRGPWTDVYAYRLEP